MAKKEEGKGVVFRRIGGRVVPISVAAGGAYAAADAARTRRVYVNKKLGITIDRKRFVHQTPVFGFMGDGLEMRKKGKLIGRAKYYASESLPKGGLEFSFGWLSVKKANRGKGLSQVLAKQATVEMKSKGGTSLWNQVVHPGSLKTGFSHKRDTIWKVTKVDGVLEKVTKKQALGNINYWRSKKGFMTSDIFRQTDLTKVNVRRTMKPFMTGGTKAKLGLGLAAFAGGTAWALRGRNEK